MTIKKLSRNDFFVMFILFAISLFLRLPGYKDLAIMPDEIDYSKYAYNILAFNWDWGPEFMVAAPPLFPYLLAITTRVFDGTFETLRLVPIFFGSLTSPVIYLLGRELYSRKVGILSALLLSFSGYHILYSQLLMLESVEIFFIFLFLYFFWKSYKEDKLAYAIASGISLGLAVNTKYSGLLLYPFIFIFILWTKRNIASLVEKRYFLSLFASFIVIFPVIWHPFLNGIYPILWQVMGRPGVKISGFDVASGFAGVKYYTMVELMMRGLNNYVDLVIDGHSKATLSLQWLEAYYISATVLLIITIIFYLIRTLKAKPADSFIFIFFAMFNAYVFTYPVKFQYYLMWNLPAFFIMLSNMIFSFLYHIKSQLRGADSFSNLNFIRISTLVFAVLFIFSFINIGLTASEVNEPPKVGFEKHIINIQNELKPGDSIATGSMLVVEHYLKKYDFNIDERNIRILSIYNPVFRYRLKKGVDFDMLDYIKPKYIIADSYYYSTYVDVEEDVIIQKDYRLRSIEDNVMLFVRIE